MECTVIKYLFVHNILISLDKGNCYANKWQVWLLWSVFGKCSLSIGWLKWENDPNPPHKCVFNVFSFSMLAFECLPSSTKQEKGRSRRGRDCHEHCCFVFYIKHVLNQNYEVQLGGFHGCQSHQEFVPRATWTCTEFQLSWCESCQKISALSCCSRGYMQPQLLSLRM